MLLPYYQEVLTEAGCDEAGRGCYAGPVFAAAVILPKDFHHPLLNDSKQLSEKNRDILRPVIEKEAIAYAVAGVDNEEIDRINILKASFKAMHLALDQLNTRPRLLLIDGNRFHPYKKIPHHCIIKGDGRYASIAAASILAKVARDAEMMALHERFPQYGFAEHKGYPTPRHLAALREYGPILEHRRSFGPVREALSHHLNNL